MNIRRLDLNLLVILDALLSEGSVTRAARRVHLAQPTVSNALARLRCFFQDPLLVRSGGQMRPTERALALALPVREALARIEQAVEPDAAIDWRSGAPRTFRIATTDYVCFVVMPRLLAHLRAVAPAVHVAVSDLNPADPLEALRSDKVDLVLGAVATTSASIHRTDLFTDRFVCVAREGYPTTRRPMGVKEFVACAHVVVRQQNGTIGGVLDDVLGQMSAERNIVLSIPHFSAAPHALLGADVMMTMAAKVAEQLVRDFPLHAMPLPVPLKPFAISMLWHQRTHASAEHRGFRSVLLELSETLERGEQGLQPPRPGAATGRPRKRRGSPARRRT